MEIIYDVCWMLTPTQIQRMCTNYYVADYEVCPTRSPVIEDSPKYTCADPHLARDPPCRRLTGVSQRSQRPPFARTRDGGGWPVRAPATPGSLRPGDLRPCIPQCPAPEETRCSGSIAVLMSAMLIRVSFCILLCYGLQCNGNLRPFSNLFIM